MSKTNNTEGVPVIPLMGFPGIQLSSTNIKENLEDADIQFESLKQLYNRFQPDGMFTMMDLTVEAEALGLETLKPENSSFTIIEHPLKNREDLKKIKMPDTAKAGRMPLMQDVVKKMAGNFRCKVLAYITGPYTFAGLLQGASTVMKNVLKKPELVKEILEFSTEIIKSYGKLLIDAGVDMICILEPTATGLSPQQFMDFSGEYIKILKKEWEIPIILHICGDTVMIIEEMVKTGCDGISLDHMVDLKEAAEKIPEDVMIIGNIDPVNIIAYGEKKEVEESVNKLLKDMKNRKNFILSTGCDLPPDTNLDNIAYMIELAKNK